MTERTLVYMDVGDLLSRFHPQNPKLHSVDELRRSMARFGYAESVILDERTGLLAAGHGRVEVLSADEKAGAKPPEGIAVADGNRRPRHHHHRADPEGLDRPRPRYRDRHPRGGGVGKGSGHRPPQEEA